MKSNDTITIEQALKVAKFCYTMGQLRGEKGEACETEAFEVLHFLGFFGSGLKILGITEGIEEVLNCFEDEIIKIDEVVKNMGIKDMIEQAEYISAIKMFAKEIKLN